MLKGISEISLAFNDFEGSIPMEFFKLENLTFLHLQRNNIIGDADDFDYKIESYITDCGSTTSTEALIVCTKCTFCCNKLNECLFQEGAWPRRIDPFNSENFNKLLEKTPSGISAFLKENQYSATLLLTGILLVCFSFMVIVLVLIIYYFPFIGMKLPKSPYQKLSFQEDSIYKFFLVKDFVAVFLAFATMFFHMLILILFLHSADYRNNDTEAAYAHTCPRKSLECTTASKVTSTGFMLFTMVVIAFLAKDFLDGILMI